MTGPRTPARPTGVHRPQRGHDTPPAWALFGDQSGHRRVSQIHLAGSDRPTPGHRRGTMFL